MMMKDDNYERVDGDDKRMMKLTQHQPTSATNTLCIMVITNHVILSIK